MTATRPDRSVLTAPGTIDHHVADLTATVSADVALSTVQETLAAMGQWLPIDADALLCGYVGDERTLAYCESTLPQWSPRSLQRRSLEEDIEHRGHLWRDRSLRADVPPAKLHEFVGSARLIDWAADAAFGVVLG